MDNKFRNHPSLMLEQLGVFGVIIITFLISSLDDLDEILGDIKILIAPHCLSSY